MECIYRWKFTNKRPEKMKEVYFETWHFMNLNRAGQTLQTFKTVDLFDMMFFNQGSWRELLTGRLG